MQRDDAQIDDTQYATQNADALMDGLGPQLRTLPLSVSSPQATFSDGAAARLFDALVARLGRGQTGITNLERVVGGPEPILRAVAHGRPHSSQMIAPEGHPEQAQSFRTGQGSPTWRPEVAMEIATVVQGIVQASLARVTPRWVAARNAALQAAWTASGTCDPNVQVTVDASSIIAAHPMDRELAALVCTADYFAFTPPVEGAAATPEVLRPVTFHFLGREGQAGWLRTTPADARPEEIAQSLYGDSAKAYTLSGGGGLWHYATGMVLPAFCDQLTPDEQSGMQPVRDMTALTGPNAAEIALAQAGPGCVGSRDDVVRDMRDSVRIFDQITASAATYGPTLHAADLAAARTRIDQRSRDVQGGSEAEATRWGAQAQQQRELLSRASTGIDQTVVQLHSMSDMTAHHGATDLPDYVRELILGIALEYADAAVFSDQVEIGRQHLAEGDRRSRTYQVDLMDHILQETQQMLAETRGDGPNAADAATLQHRQRDLRARVMAMRARLLANPAALGTEMQQLMTDIQDLQQGSSMLVNMDAVDTAMAVLSDTNGFWATVTFHSGSLDRLRSEGQGYHTRWRAAYTLWQQGDHAGAQHAVDQLRQDEAFRGYLGRVQSEVHDARIAAAIAQIVAALAVMVITAGVGELVAGAAVGLEWSAGGVAAAQVTAEAATFTTLNAALFERDPTVTSVAGDFVFNLALFGAMRVIGVIARAGALGRAVEEGGAAGRAVQAGEMSAQFLLTTVAGMVRDDLQRRDRGLPPPTEDETRQMFIQNLAMFIIGAIITNLARRPLLEPLRNAGGRMGARYTQLQTIRTALGARAQGLRASRNIEYARQLLASERTLLEQEQSAFRELQQQVDAATPEERARILGENHLTEDQYQQMRGDAAENEQHLAQMRRAEIMTAVEPIGAGLYAAPRDVVPDLLRAHQQQGAQVEVLGQDPVTGERTFRVTYPDGQQMRIIERGGEPRPGQAGQPPPTAQQAADAHAGADRARVELARMQASLTRNVDSRPVVRVQRLVAGGGVAATMDYATLPATAGMTAPGVDIPEGAPLPSTLAIGGAEPWQARATSLAQAAAEHGVPQPLLSGGRIGQSVGDWGRSSGLTSVPGEFNSNHAGPGRAQDVADAVVMTQYQAGMVVYDGAVLGIEVNPHDGTWDVDAPARARVASPSHPNGEFFVYADVIDAALGRGAARGLTETDAPGRPREISPEDRATLLANRRLVYYDQAFRNPRQGRVLVVGDGPTAVWVAGTASEIGSQVTVLGRPTEAADQTALRDAQQHVIDGTPNADAELQRIQTEVAQRVFARSRATTGGRYFSDPNIQYRGGQIARVRAGDPAIPAEAGKIMVEITPGRWEAFDQVALSIGQDATAGSAGPDGAPGPDGLPGVGRVLDGAGPTPTRIMLHMVIVDGRLVRLESADGSVRVIGASMSPTIQQWVDPTERPDFLRRVEAQTTTDDVPAASRGVVDSIYQQGANIPLGNRGLTGTDPSTAPPPTTPTVTTTTATTAVPVPVPPVPGRDRDQ